MEIAFAERIGMDVTVIPINAAALTRSREKTRRNTIEVTPEIIS